MGNGPVRFSTCPGERSVNALTPVHEPAVPEHPEHIETSCDSVPCSLGYKYRLPLPSCCAGLSISIPQQNFTAARYPQQESQCLTPQTKTRSLPRTQRCCVRTGYIRHFRSESRPRQIFLVISTARDGSELTSCFLRCRFALPY